MKEPTQIIGLLKVPTVNKDKVILTMLSRNTKY